MVAGAEGFRNRHARMLVVLLAGVLMAALDIAVVGPALPAITAEFGIGERTAAWIYTAYVLAGLVGTPLMARLSDIYGRRAVYIADVSLFAAGSLLFALAPHPSLLLLGRAVQGFGAGGIFPVANAAVGDMYTVEKRGLALGILQAVFGISLIAGPVIGGLLLMVSWRLLFLINLPVAAVVVWAAARHLPAARRYEGIRFDAKGTVLLGLTAVAFSWGISGIDSRAVTASLLSPRVGPPLLLSFALLPYFIAYERTLAHPVLPVRLFCSRQVALGSLVSAGTGLCLATLVFIPALAVRSLGFGRSAASFAMVPLVLSTSLVSIIAGKLLERVSAKAEMLAGTVMTAGGLLLLGRSGGDFAAFVAAEIVFGAGFAAMPIRFVMLSAVPARDRTASQGLLSMTMSIGQMIGGVFIGALIASRGGTAQGYLDAFTTVALIACAMVAVSFGIQGGATRDAEAVLCGEGEDGLAGEK